MNKLILILLLLTSCNKDKCYVCTFGVVNGYQKQPVEVCGEAPDTFLDSLNNPLPFNCINK